MKITIGFPEVALITSVFFYQQSWWAGVILATIAVLGRGADYLLKHQSETERKKQFKEANDALKESIEALASTQKPGKFKPTLVFTDPKYDGTPQ
jgi:membrane protein YqaA with SNARE-associated domain